jgi:hypothetical protein
VLSNTIKQKRKEKAGKWEVPLPKVRRGSVGFGLLALAHRLERATVQTHHAVHTQLHQTNDDNATFAHVC